MPDVRRITTHLDDRVVLTHIYVSHNLLPILVMAHIAVYAIVLPQI
ncbi:MAG TPA: hypothetical protein VMT82_05215 [candidate division Zixibacteria bacterium]|nr:hypothetical protein [candidate division Zixibacteria bacterium]